MADLTLTPDAGRITVSGYAPLVTYTYDAGAEATLVQTLPRLFPKQTVPMVDASFRVTNEWYRYLSASLESATTGVNALDPTAVAQAIQDSRTNVLRLQTLTTAISAMLEQNASSQAATVATVQAI
ncbi:MAG: hypothetical protein ABIO63_13585, partial [Casimicrobiaceae bacterium]